MKEYNKSVKLEHVAYDIRGPVLEEAMRMRANGERILRLNTGNPAEFGFTAPDEVIHDLICIEVAFVSVLPFKRTCLVWLGKVIVASLLAGIVTFNNKLLSFFSQ